MNYRILITGSEGLVGTALRRLLETRGVDVVGLDLVAKGGEQGDVCDKRRVVNAIKGCDGVVHLAAISRVLWAENDPDRCWSTNVEGLDNVIQAAMNTPHQPWFIFASSREVYGRPETLPVSEDRPLNPINIYGRAKAEGERIVERARNRGLRAAIVRLSNVYGSARDHTDRVVPAFAKAALLNRPIRVDGSDHTFDFTHIDDTVRGIVALIDLLAMGKPAPPPIHLLTGRPTTLGQLAKLAVDLTESGSLIEQAPPRSYDVSHFYGSPARAGEVLNWTARTMIQEGLNRLIEEFRMTLDSQGHER